MTTTAAKGTALITGASSGIGAVYADRLARRGYDLILVARNRDRLAALAQRLENETGRPVRTIPANLNDKGELAAVETTLRTDASITLLVNNAGVGAIASILDSDVEKMEEMIRLNVGALTRLTYAAAPDLSHAVAAPSSTSRGSSPSRRSGSTESTAPAKHSFWPSANRSNMSLRRKACVCRPWYLERRPRSSGMSPATRSPICRRRM
jgi:NADP-dependent 3-hydroxy acid dehydrogenase YdfG